MFQLKNQSVFVNRDEELEELKKNMEKVINEKGTAVFLRGEAGVGKTRLAGEFERYVLSKGMLFLKSECLQYGSIKPYSPFVDALTNYFQTGASGENIRKIIEETPLSILKMVPVMSAFSQAFGITKKEEISASLRDEKERIFENIYNLILRISGGKPIVIFLDNLQWADESSLFLLHYMARGMGDSRIMLCCAYSPETLNLPGMEKHSGIIQLMEKDKMFIPVDIKRLNKNNVFKMVKSVTSRDDVPSRLIDFVYEKTDGNPLFVEEMVRSIIGSRIAYVENDEWVVKDFSLLKTPGTIKDVFNKTLDKLDENSRKILEAASAIGYRFQQDILENVTDTDKKKLVELLNNLANMRIISKYETKHGVYMFIHAMMQDVAYHRLSKNERGLLHKKTAETLERLYKDNINEVLYDLVMHFANTNEYKKTLYYSLTAGEKAKNAFAPDEAVKYYKIALGSLEKLESTMENKGKRVDILLDLGDIYRVTGEWDTALQQYENAAKISREINNEKQEASSYIKIGEIKSERNRWDEAIKNFEKGLKIAEKNNDVKGMGEAYKNIGYVHWRKAEFDKSLGYFNKTMECGKKINNPLMVAYANLRIGTVYSEKGEKEKGIEYLQKSIDISGRHGDFHTMAAAYNNIGEIYRGEGKYDEAIWYYKKQIEMAEKTGYVRLMGFGLSNSSECYAKKGELDLAKEFCDRALKIFTKLDEKYMIAASYHNYGLIYRFKKDWDKAIEYYHDCIKILENLNMPFDLAEIYYNFALLYKDKGDKKEMLSYLMKGKELSEKIGAKGWLEKIEKEITETKA
ncbi:MAG: tetratricopeptide repeat protein [Thermoplasmatales archaeon]|nr:tetratricopeptide repeat protein [Thermoplasmatales archaeon]